MIVFGGSTASSYQNDTWVLSNADGLGGTPDWTQLSPAGAAPGIRVDHTAVYNPTVNEMVVFGGAGPTGIRFNDVWALSNANGLGGTPVWTQITSTGVPPSPRRGATAVYNSTSNRMTIYAGLDSDCSATGDLWVLSNVATPTPTTCPAGLKVLSGGYTTSVHLQVCLLNRYLLKGCPSRLHSYLSATIGSTFAARRAGT
jgi:hypothetical protein